MNEERPATGMIFGEVASSGLARGAACVCDCTDESVVIRRLIDPAEATTELQRINAAITLTLQDLFRLQKEVEQNIGPREAAIFEAQILQLRDSSLREEITARIVSGRLNAEAAVDDAFEKFVSAFMKLEDLLFRERASDLRELRKRLLDALGDREPVRLPVLPKGGILVARQLLSSVMAQLNDQTIRGLVLENGGQTAHATILARACAIPLLIHVADATKRIRNGDQLIIDGMAGRVFINPGTAVIREYDQLEAQLHARKTALQGLTELPATTLDGVPVKLSANIGKSADAVMSASLNADGAGLYRTEFVFLVQNQFPSEEEQYQVYRTTAESLKPRDVVIRVLDIGSDKLLPYFRFPVEANPSLGRRGTRLLLAHPEVLRTQLRAVLRLSATHPVSILFPMIGGVEDMVAAKSAVEMAKNSLRAEGRAFNPRVPIGAMIETPAAAIMAERLASEADFFSIGTNDLVQYLLTTDRTSSEVASYYEPLHPAVLRVLASVAAAAKVKGTSVSICGEMAGNPAFTRLLLGLGFLSLSVNPGEMLEVKNAIRATTLSEARELADQVLQLGTIQEVKDCLRAATYKESQKGANKISPNTGREGGLSG